MNTNEKYIAELEETNTRLMARIAELERQLAARTGKVQRVAHLQLDAILQPVSVSDDDNRLWA